MERKIAIVGAGLSGLMACKYMLDKGFRPVVFEARSSIGGVWTETLESTKLQTPKHLYQFSDFPWPRSVKETFPGHDQVLDYVHAYAARFSLLPLIKFNTKVTGIDFVPPSDEDVSSWDSWGGSGEPFSATGGKWKVSVKDARDPSAPIQVYEVDFVILCIGIYSDVPNIPEFPPKKGPEAFRGKVVHSMEYAAMDNNKANEFTTGKRVTVVGFSKSAVDLASEIAHKNGAKHPCTLLLRRAHWMVPEQFLSTMFMALNRFSELMLHKPGEGFFLWLLAFLLSPMMWMYGKLCESYLKWLYPLKKYDMVPQKRFLTQIGACMLTVLPANFFKLVKEGRLILRKSQSFSFCEEGLMLEGDAEPLRTDVVILATGYKSDEKLKSIFKSTDFRNCILGSFAPFYRECVHPRIPHLAILGYATSPSVLYTTEIRVKWLACFLSGGFKLPRISKMEAECREWEEFKRRIVKERYRRCCISSSLTIYCNDQICQDMGCAPTRKKSFLAELFAPYGPRDYENV